MSNHSASCDYRPLPDVNPRHDSDIITNPYIVINNNITFRYCLWFVINQFCFERICGYKVRMVLIIENKCDIVSN